MTFFPSGDPNFIYVYLKMPVGTDVNYTDSITHVLEKRVTKVLENELPTKEGGIVESIITNVAVSANKPTDNNRSTQPNLGRIQVSFVQFEAREGKKTKPFLRKSQASELMMTVSSPCWLAARSMARCPECNGSNPPDTQMTLFKYTSSNEI